MNNNSDYYLVWVLRLKIFLENITNKYNNSDYYLSIVLRYKIY